MLSVVADFSTLDSSRKFIDTFENLLAPIKIISCEWKIYPKFKHSYWYDWCIRSENSKNEIYDKLQSLLGAEWCNLSDDETIWNRPEEIDPADQPVRWIHFFPMDSITSENVQKLKRGPSFVKSSDSIVSVSQSGKISGLYNNHLRDKQDLID